MSNRFAVVGGTVVTPVEVLEQGTVLCEDGRIVYAGRPEAAEPQPGSEILDATGCIVFPGLIDTHVHGSGGDDVMADGVDGIRRVSRVLLRQGVTGYLVTSIAAKRDELLLMIEHGEEARRGAGPAADVLGYHLEGPFINRTYKGAQPDEGIRDPDLDECRELLAAAPDQTKIMTLAPELPGGLELIKLLVGEDVVPSMGHSDADYDMALAAIDAGAFHATHLYNAMSGVNHRQPGLASACLNEPGIIAELILDGVHVHPKMARLAARAKGCDRLVLITDATSAQGCGDGTYKLGGFEILVRGPVCTLMDGTTIAGSVLTMNSAARNAQLFLEASLIEVAFMASLLPARLCGVENERGSIEPGKRADLAVMGHAFDVKHTVLEGRLFSV